MMNAMITRASIGAAAAVGLALAGCGGGQDQPVIDAPTLDAAPPEAITFRLSYQSDVPDSIFVQSGTGAGGQGWLTIHPVGGGPALAILDDCGLCDCASCGSCPVCGQAQPEVTELARGTALDWSWDVRVFERETCSTSNLTCERATFLAPGDYIARFCWSLTSDGVGPNHHVGPLVCADEPLVFPRPAAAPPIEHAECACG